MKLIIAILIYGVSSYLWYDTGFMKAQINILDSKKLRAHTALQCLAASENR